MSNSNNIYEIVTGKNEHEEHVFSVLVKRSYTIRNNKLYRKPVDNKFRKTDYYYDNGEPEWSTVQYEHDLAPYKPATDIVIIGKAYAPDGSEVQQMRVDIQIGERQKSLIVTGNRECHYRDSADPIFSEPEPFTEMEIRYDNAYGGQDIKSSPELPFYYPRNFMGKGVALHNTQEQIQGLALPNIEPPDDLLKPEQVIIGEPENWHLQPLPQSLGWYQRTFYPRSALLGAYPAFTDVGVATLEEKMGLLPKDHIALAKQFRLPTYDAYFNNGASNGMTFRNLNGNEQIHLSGLTPYGTLKFQLPKEHPSIALDIGLGEKQLSSKLHTISIRPDDLEVDIIWQGITTYEGYSWFSKMTRLHAEVW